ncbi:DUF7507 domain-containing protein [Aestuariivirga litoralis]|uniref:DUF7507 domain-containing protein n=1 Tax=Aestuariivirga litoralis TaxID=2650924 RepID=UPI0018C6B5F5|nr:hypothetical protein [Aestuariivirga litoralis]MBG1233476.1 hypothetical protein [Aestuariivirga litoralis]
MTSKTSALFNAYLWARRARVVTVTALTGTLVAAQVTPSYATIDNTANAVGTYNSSPGNYGSSSQSVPVAPATPTLTIVKTAGTPSVSSGTDTSHTDSGDTITYTYLVTNTGNVTMSNVVPTDPGPTFYGYAEAATLGAFSPTSATLAPGASQSFTATYTLATLDVYHAADQANGVSNTAGATGTYGPSNTAYSIPTINKSTATTTITGNPNLTITKTFVIKDTGGATLTTASVGSIVTYTYTIYNSGTVTMTNVKVNDVHFGSAVAIGGSGITNETLSSNGPLGAAASSDGATNNGIWSVLAPGATVTMTWAHTVTQAEFDHG